MESGYPKREPFFANKFVRLMTRTCLGATVGPDGFALLTIIAMTEDAKRYSGPVTFFNPNLADQMGISISSLDRAREKAVNAGWLHYETGGKSKAGKYWVVIPPEEIGKPDTPSCEPSEPLETAPFNLSRQMPIQLDDVSGEHVTKKAEGICVDKRGVCDDHSSLPLPNPCPSIDTQPSPFDDSKNDPPPANYASQTFGRFWDPFVRKEHKKKCEMIWRGIIGSQVDPRPLVEKIIAKVQAWAPIWKARQPENRPVPSTWLEGERWNDELPTEQKHKDPELERIERADKLRRKQEQNQ